MLPFKSSLFSVLEGDDAVAWHRHPAGDDRLCQLQGRPAVDRKELARLAERAVVDGLLDLRGRHETKDDVLAAVSADAA